MIGYNVFFHVEHSKKPYNSTEFYLQENEALSRALELSVAVNVTTIKIDKFEISDLSTRYIKSNGVVTFNPDEFIKRPDISFNDYLKKYFVNKCIVGDKNATVKK